jgi:hypothetical protein
MVRNIRPILILEYGSGYSTIALAKALVDNGKGRLLTLENSPEWAKITSQRLSSDLTRVVELAVCTPEGVTRTGYFDTRSVSWARMAERRAMTWTSMRRPAQVGVMGLTYKEAAGLRPDLVLVDGPSKNWTTGYVDSFGRRPPPIVMDPLIHEQSYQLGTRLVLDWRPSNTRFLVNNLTRNWRFVSSSLSKQNYFTLIGN